MTAAKYNNRKVWIGILLLATVLAAIWPVPEREKGAVSSAPGENGSPPARPAATAGAATAKISFLPLSPKAQAGSSVTANDLFPAQTWNPPVSSSLASASAVKQEPVPPPLPFTFGGRYVEGSDTMIFLMEGNQIHRVRKGETVKEVYRVEKIESAFITLTYLPLGTTQILPTGGLLP